MKLNQYINSFLVPKNGQIVMLEQVGGNAYYYFTCMETTKLLNIECELLLHSLIRF
jgi:hypothetical protein